MFADAQAISCVSLTQTQEIDVHWSTGRKQIWQMAGSEAVRKVKDHFIHHS